MFGRTKAGRWGRTRPRVASVLAGLGVVVALGACNDDDFNLVEPLPTRVVTVFRDSSFNFRTLHTFAMPDTVVHFEPATGLPLVVSRQFDQVALNSVRQNLLSRGYTQVINPSVVRPDFIVLVGVTATPSYNAFAGYSWFSVWGFSPVWGWFGPGFNTTWGIGYPWFGIVGVTAFERGTLIVDLIPTSGVNASNRTIRSAWTGIASSLLDGSISANTITSSIDQMFALSPYLTATP